MSGVRGRDVSAMRGVGVITGQARRSITSLDWIRLGFASFASKKPWGIRTHERRILQRLMIAPFKTRGQ